MALRGFFGLRGIWGLTASDVSQAQINICGIPDGNQQIRLWRDSTLELLFNGVVAFNDGIADIEVNVPSGSTFIGIWKGDNPPTTGSGIYGVTHE